MNFLSSKVGTGKSAPLQSVLAGKPSLRSPGPTSAANLSGTTIRPVGSGKTALMLQLCKNLRENYSIAAVTNDIFTKYPRLFSPFILYPEFNLFSVREDQEFLVKNEALEAKRIRAIETGGCPHAAGIVTPFLKATGLSYAKG